MHNPIEIQREAERLTKEVTKLNRETKFWIGMIFVAGVAEAWLINNMLKQH